MDGMLSGEWGTNGTHTSLLAPMVLKWMVVEKSVQHQSEVGGFRRAIGDRVRDHSIPSIATMRGQR